MSTFEQLIETEIDIITLLDERTFTGSLEYDSEINDYVAAPSGDGGYIVSISNDKGLLGSIEIHPAGVIYRNANRSIVYHESRMKQPLSIHAIKTYFLPTLLRNI